jgi:hypothetical protein
MPQPLSQHQRLVRFLLPLTVCTVFATQLSLRQAFRRAAVLTGDCRISEGSGTERYCTMRRGGACGVGVVVLFD